MLSRTCFLVLFTISFAAVACRPADAISAPPVQAVRASVASTITDPVTPYDIQADIGGTCSSVTRRDFGFWVGRWRVDGAGAPTATSTISTALRDCAILEHFVGPDGLTGRSLTSFDQGAGKWRQMYVDAGNTTLVLEGGVNADGVMDLRQRRPIFFNGPVRTDVITWRTMPSGVVQRWDASEDNGITFTNLFEGTYRHATLEPAAPLAVGVCSNPVRPRFFDFDFTLGDWTVSRRSGGETTVVGRSKIARTLDGCLLEERFTGDSHPVYESIGFGSFDVAFRRWHREYVDSRGARVILANGALLNGAMVLTGESIVGAATINYRVTWTRVSDAQFTVRWESSTNGAGYSTHGELVFDRVQ